MTKSEIVSRLCYEKQCNLDGVTVDIMILKRNYGWDVFYAKENYALTCAFGLGQPPVSIEDAFKIAEANMPQYKFLWEE